VSISLQSVNDAPTGVGDQYTTTQDTPLSIAPASGVLANDRDVDGNALSVVGFDASSSNGGSVSVNPNGSFSYTPPAGFVGTDSFGYSLSDGTSQAAAQVSVTVKAPGSGLAQLVGTVSHETLDVRTAAQGYEIQALAGHDVVHGSAFADLIVGGPGFDQMFGYDGDDVFLIVGVDVYADFVYGGQGTDAIVGSTGDDVFLLDAVSSVELIDGRGGTDVLAGHEGSNYWNLSATTLTGIVAIEGRGGHDQIQASAGDDRVIGGAGNDILDGGGGVDTAVYGGNFASYVLTALSGGRLGVSTSANTDGADTLSNFEILEFADGTWANGVFTPFGDPTNTAPVAAADAYAGTEDQVLQVNALAGVLANDQDADGDALVVHSFDAQSARGASVQLNADGSFVYTPTANFNGPDSFSYTVADGRGGLSDALVSISLQSVNDAPTGVGDQYTTTQDTPLSIAPASGVLANDRDADGDALSVVGFDASSSNGGSVSVNPNGSFSYTSPVGFVGTDSFGYSLSDGTSQVGAVVSVTVNEPGTTLSLFEQILVDLPEGEWARLNINQFHEVWTPLDQRPQEAIGGNPQSVIQAWGAATWDANRSLYIFWGGGHANYEGNEVYFWSAETLEWHRGSLPSGVVNVAGAHYETVDGYEHSPISSHAYDNMEFRPDADRMVTFGGAAAHTGNAFVETDGITLTGPYFWDPAKADANMVGGLDGSNVNPEDFPEVMGGQMWENRAIDGGTPPIVNMVNGTTDYARIGTSDVVFVNDSSQKLYKYTVPDVGDSSQDTWELVGTVWDTYSGAGAGAYDATRNIYLRTSDTSFTYWDLSTSGPTNRNVNFMPTDATGEFQLNGLWGMEYDPVRDRFVLWQGKDSVWMLEAPEQLGANGWTLTEASPVAAGPTTPVGFTGVLGKWDYVDEYDVFIGVTNHITGDVWAYKPEGWSPESGLV
jgi:hypothetical protein